MGLINVVHKWKLYKLVREVLDNPKKLLDPKFFKSFWKEIWSVKEIREMLQGYKTYIVAALTAALTLLHSLGYIDDATYQSLLALLGSGAIATVAAKINRIQKDK